MKATIPIAVLAAVILCPTATRADSTDSPVEPYPPGEKPRVHHVPVAEVLAGDSVVIEADISQGWSADLILRVRPIASKGPYRSVVFERMTGDLYAATIPTPVIAPPGFEYYLATGQPEHVHFASADRPHPVRVRLPDAVAEHRQELARHDGRRAQVQFRGEYVDFGRRTVTDVRTGDEYRVRDAYYRVEGDFTYRLFRRPLRELRFGYMRLVGTTPVTARGDGDCGSDSDCSAEAGFRGGAWFELRFRLSQLIASDVRGLIVATPSGVGFGGRGELRFGDELGSHFAAGTEAIQEVGTTVFVRLGWDTVPRFPMSTSIELTDYPSAHRDAGVRLLYDVAYATPSGLRFGGRFGYQARDQFFGGFTAGLSATLDFWAL